MKKKVMCFLLQLKRVAHFIPFVLAVSLCISLALGALLRFVIIDDNSSEDKQKIKIAVVGDTNDSYLGFGISALKTLDISKYMVELVEMQEEQARQGVANGDIAACVIIPDGFIDGVLHGKVLPLTYVTTNSTVSITSIFKEEMLTAISRMLVESQNGVYAMQYVMESQGVFQGFADHTDRLNINYFELVLGRNLMCKEEIIGVSDRLSFPAYILCGISVLLIFLCGIACCPLFVKRDMALPKLLRATGHGAFSQVISEYGAYFLLMFFNIFIIFVAASTVLGDSVSIIGELSGYTAVHTAKLALSFIPAVLLITSLQFLLYEISSGIVSGVLLQFITAIALTYIGGCFYPISFFPELIQRVAVFLPSGMAREYLAHCLTESQTLVEVGTVLFCGVLFIGIATAVRSYRIVRE